MFSELIKREVTKLILVVFLYTNLSPSFCMQGMPEYVVNVEHRQIANKESAEMQTAFAVTAMQLVQESATVVYRTITEQIIYPFMLAATATFEASIRLYEILQNVKANITDGEKETEKSDEIDTEISRGFCLNIPELGDLLISHDGDIILDAKEQLKRSVRVVAPKQVILNGVIAKDIEVESTAAILTGKTSARIDSLKFKAIRDSEDLENALFIDEGASLEVGMLSLESALLLNTGRLTVERIMDLQEGMFFNTGTFGTKADPVTLKNIAYFYNGSRGVITSVGDIILNGGRIINSGKIEARGINLVSSELFHNEGEILTTAFFNINGLGELINEGKINGSSGTIDIRGARFEQRQGYLLGAKIVLNTGESILYGEVRGAEGFFHGNIQNAGTLNFQRGVLSGNFVNSGNINIERLLELIGTRVIIRNSGELKAGEIVSEATEGVINTEISGKVITETIRSKKHLQLEADMPILKTVKTEKGAKLLVTKEAKTPKLQKIENHGDSTFILGETELSIIQNAVDSFLRLESSSPFEKLSGFEEIHGTVILKGLFPRLIKLNILSGSKFTLLPGSCFTEVKEVYIQSRGQIEFHTDAFKMLKGLTNSGALIVRGAQETETEGFSVSLSPAALLSAAIVPGIASNLACLPSMSVSESDGHMERTTYLPMRFNANKLFVQCDNAVFSGSQIRAKMIEMIVTGDLTIESLRDTLRVESSNSAINGSLAAVFSSVHKVDNRAIMDPKLGAVPTLRIADEEEITEKVNILAGLIGEEKFYLEVGGLLYQKGAEIGLKPDGLVTKTESERIEAERILKANIPEKHTHKRHVINPTVGELVACMGQIDEFKQVRAQFITERLAEGATMEEAAEEGEKLQELLETPEVKESYREIKVANEKLIKAAEKIEKIDQETREKSAGMSQPQMEEFLKISYQSIERQNAVQEYNTIARGCLIQATKLRIGIQNWAKEHPTYTKVAEMAMDAVRYSVMITSTIALVSSFASTAPISIPVAIAGVGVAIAKDKLIDWGIEELVNFASKQGTNLEEKEEFKETAEWVIGSIQKFNKIKDLSRIAKDPIKEMTPKFTKTYTKLDKYGEIAVILNQASRAYSKNQKEILLSEVLDNITNVYQ